ncbi:helix-turn-helix domain-containing protein [Albimonas pacifica]|uniref:Transcriptional regulator, ArsR family n=1 Tax=Albimonas pacifica TaxID=1114924 RepID=A0A1I3P5X2_9RHOB|nr:helix-turn-helix domain-containing protein [Albimonas pacifica]SFJ16436.1 transcriptional regulator, ArsR family [Albimonas pacifica]
MESDRNVEAFAALGHPGRLAVFRLLARRAPDGVRPSEIAQALGMKANTLSVNVSGLARAGLVTSERRGKSVFYSIDLARAGGLVDYLVSDCCRGRPETCIPLAARALQPLGDPSMTAQARPFDVLFICTGNSARSIFAEAILRKEGGGRFRAFSAGTRPYSELNPRAVATLKDFGHDVSTLRAKHVSEFQGPDAPRLDFVFTVCDPAANEECPPWPGQPVTAHWGMPDPVKAEGTEAEKGLAFLEAYRALQRRISAFVSLPLESLDRISLQMRLDAIAHDQDRDRDAPAA